MPETTASKPISLMSTYLTNIHWVNITNTHWVAPGCRGLGIQVQIEFPFHHKVKSKNQSGRERERESCQELREESKSSSKKLKKAGP